MTRQKKKINQRPALPDSVDQRLLDARHAACAEMHRLIDERGDSEFTAAAARQFFHLTRRVASIDAARHEGNLSALTGPEIAWLQSQGVALTGADLIAALQASPYRDIDIEPER
jgi:hypothetical protein